MFLKSLGRALGASFALAGWLLATPPPNDTAEVPAHPVEGRPVGTPFSLQPEESPASSPGSDDFAHSILIEGAFLEAGGLLSGCTREPGEPVHDMPSTKQNLTGATMWWSWRTPVNGRASLWVSDTELTHEWALVVYQGSNVDQLTRVRQRLNLYDSRELAFSADAGEVYHIACEQREGGDAAVQFQLVLEPSPDVPANDDFAQATILPIKNVLSRASVQGATREPGEPEHGNGTAGKSLWWQWRPPFNCIADVSNSGTAFPATVAVYRGSTLTNLQRVGAGVETARMRLQGGEAYYVAMEVPVEVSGDLELGIGGSPNGEVIPTPGDLLVNGSFEEGDNGGAGSYWTRIGMDSVVNQVGLDGHNYMIFGFGSALWQDVPTTVGTPYRLRFGTHGIDTRGPVQILVFANETQILDYGYDSLTDPLVHWPEVVFVADTATTRIRFASSGSYSATLDAVSLVAMSEPPTIVRSPVSQNVAPGASAAFEVAARGTEPLVYRWFHNGEEIAGEQSPILYLSAVATEAAGEYRCLVTNAYGEAETEPALLTVEAPAEEPEILLHPEGAAVVTGEYHVLAVVAQGRPPLDYQWFKDGEPIPDATESRIVFDPYMEDDAGVYHVRVNNEGAGVRSLPATLRSIPPVPGGGTLSFGDMSLMGPAEGLVPVYDADGITVLQGPGFAAQLYVGLDGTSMHPVRQPAPFLSGMFAGYWDWQWIRLPHVEPGIRVTAQVRAWDTSFGASYEEARARGGKHGRSEPVEVITAAEDTPGAALRGLESFRLETGRPAFSTGRLDLIERGEDGALTWRLTGAPGYRYLIEVRVAGGDWEPFQVRENPEGTLVFTDQPAGGADSVMYRSRILD